MRPMFTALMTVLSVASAMPAMAQAVGYQVVTVTDGGRIAGRVTLKGTAPDRERLAVTFDMEVCGRTAKLSETLIVAANGGVRNAIVHLRDIAQGKSWRPTRNELVQANCEFAPHMLLVPQGADLHVVNTDRIAHQVRSSGANLALNIEQPRYVEKLLVPDFAKAGFPETVAEVWCDIHPWMHAHVVVEKHPYYARTDVDGAYRLTGVPPGQYELALWHETLGEVTRRVTVKANAQTSVSFAMEWDSGSVLEYGGRTGTP